MRRKFLGFFGAVAFTALTLASGAHAAQKTWTEGKHCAVLSPVQKTTVPAGKIEVLEVFSYGCSACNSFQPVIEQLKTSLPAKAQMAYLHASFRPDESWHIFQRAYYAARSLKVDERTHQAVFDAIWKTGELSIVDPGTRKLRKPQPTIEDAARCYSRLTGIKEEDFLAATRSFNVDAQMRAADAQVRAMQVPGTPCLVVNGKYRVVMDDIASIDQLVGVVKFLVDKESGK